MNHHYRWVTWLLGTLAGFTWLEWSALRGDGRTLTATFRHWLGVDPKASRRHVLGPLFTGFLVWLYGHMVRGWRP